MHEVRRLQFGASPDPRALVEETVRQLAQRIRRQPTVPASCDDPREPWGDALSEATAPNLPPKHCAQRFVKHSFVAKPPWSCCAEVPTKRFGSEPEGANPHDYLAPSVVSDTLLCALQEAPRVALKGLLEASPLCRGAPKSQHNDSGETQKEHISTT